MASTATAVVRSFRPTGTQLSGTFVLDPSSLTTLTGEVATITVPGVKATDTAVVSPQTALTAGLCVQYVRCAANTITVGLFNATGGTINEASGTWNFTVHRGTSGRL